MPYIDIERRKKLDEFIDLMILSLKRNVSSENEVSNEQFLDLSGDLNYCLSRILSGVMTKVSYSKIAIITGILENVKQEYYRRVASIYEDSKIDLNGDIKEYKNTKIHK